MSPLFDALEAREPAQREAALMAALPAQLAHARKSSPAYAELLQGFEVEQVTTRAALASLPVVRKHELQERQIAARTASDVFGGFSTVGKGAAMPRVFSSPGSIYEPEVTARDYFCGRLSARRTDSQQLQLPLRAGRFHDGNGCPCHGLLGVSGWHGANRTTGPGHA